MKKITKPTKIAFAALMTAALLGACSSPSNSAANSSAQVAEEATAASYSTTGTSLTVADLVSFDEDDQNAVWSEDDATVIELNGSDATVSGDGAAVSGGSVTITEAGTYVLSGTLDDGQILIDAGDEDVVHLVLNGVSITDQDNAPIYAKAADKTIITLADGTENTVADGSSYTLEDGEDEPSAAIFSKNDLTINGTGSLTVTANYNDGITSKDDLKIVSGAIKVQSVDDGIVGRDLLAVQDGTVTIVAEGDGMKATNDEDADKGVIALAGGTFDIESANDAIQAETTLVVDGGDYHLVTGGGSANAEVKTESGPGQGMGGGMGGMGGGRPMQNGETTDGASAAEPPAATGTDSSAAPSDSAVADEGSADTGTAAGTESEIESDTDESDSAKGLKSGGDMMVNGGSFDIDSADDAVHSNSNVTVNDGQFTIAAGDDAMHADTLLTIAGGTIDITSSYEGVEGGNILISGGDVKLVASDDGVNASGTETSTETETTDTSTQEQGQRSGGFGGGASNGQLTISGGTLYVNASGDGIDVNGSGTMTGGTVLVDGPTDSGNAALDYDGTFDVSGGVLITAGSSGMAQSTSDSSSQSSIMMTFSETQTAGTLIHVEDSSGNTIATYAPSKDYTAVLISSPDLAQGETYTLYSGGSSTGTATNGLYADGEYSGGTKVVEFELSSIATWLNESGVTEANTGHGMGGGGMGGGRGQ